MLPLGLLAQTPQSLVALPQRTAQDGDFILEIGDAVDGGSGDGGHVLGVAFGCLKGIGPSAEGSDVLGMPAVLLSRSAHGPD
jgi:hypothetical protein